MMNNMFEKLYKYTKTGAIQEWQIFVEGNKFWTVEGQKDGVLTTSLPTICKPKNIGKKNETSGNEQALLEAKSKYQKKLDKGYNKILQEGSLFFEPMLANDFKKSKDIDFKKYKIFIQPKLDGLRCINEKNKLMSRNGKEYVSCPHLYQSNTILDGELYNHKYHNDFNKIVSLCKKIKPTEEELDESKERVQYWIYDFPSHKGVFSERYKALKNWIKSNDNQSFIVVETHEVKSIEDIKKYHDKFLELGYEGSIIRIDMANYENKRSKQLLKYKDFVDEEFEIVGAVEGEGGRTGTLGKFWMRLYNNKPYSIEKDENVFKSNVKGDFKYLKFLWDNHKKYIGREATVKYFQRTPIKEDGSGNEPRFPYIIKIDRDEYE
jgi:DNA ligase-1